MKTILIYFLLLVSAYSFSQQANSSHFHSPTKASVLSAIIPGAGQVYNKKYWKVPIIYASLFTSIYFINDNQTKFNIYKDAFITRENGGTDDYINIYDTSQLITIMDYYERNRDISYIITSAIYILNIVDASVDAHLFHYDINEDLSIEWHPTLRHDAIRNNAMLTLKMNF